MDADLYEIHELVSFGGDARQAGATSPPSSAMAAPAVYEQSNDELVGLGLSSEGTSLRSGLDVAVLESGAVGVLAERREDRAVALPVEAHVLCDLQSHLASSMVPRFRGGTALASRLSFDSSMSRSACFACAQRCAWRARRAWARHATSETRTDGREVDQIRARGELR